MIYTYSSGTKYIKLADYHISERTKNNMNNKNTDDKMRKNNQRFLLLLCRENTPLSLNTQKMEKL